MQITYQIKTGDGKNKCEDHALVYLAENHNSYVLNNDKGCIDATKPCIIAIADGVGGNPGGYEASGFTLTQLSKTALNIAHDEQSIKQSIISLNDDLLKYASTCDGKERMATTLSALFITDNSAIYAHAGNTRVYTQNNLFLKQLTSDHTTYQMLKDQGLFDAAENCNKCEITSCLGGGKSRNLAWLNVSTFATPDRQPKTLLLTTDGIHEFVDINFLEDTMSNNDITDLEKTDILINESLKNGSTDDKTILIVRF
jgi:PPM family protein phosphatase